MREPLSDQSESRGYTEDSPEVYRAACALSHYYDGDGGDAEDWMGGAIVALRAAFRQDGKAAFDERHK